MNFKLWTESNIQRLYQSTVAAFPFTKYRQNATDPINITELKLTPFVGMKTLFIKSTAQNPDSKTFEHSKYKPMILFKNVQYHNENNQNLVKLIDEQENIYFIEKISTENNNVMVRCDCGDFFWRGNYADWLDKSLFGSKKKKYESKGGVPANPKNAPMMCKHIIKMTEILINSGIIN